MHFPLKTPASQFVFFYQIISWEFQLNFGFYSFAMKKKTNSTHWHIVVVFSLALLMCFFLHNKTENYCTKKMRVTDFSAVHLLNRYALFCVNDDLHAIYARFLLCFFSPVSRAFKYYSYSVLLFASVFFYPKTVLHFMPLLWTLLLLLLFFFKKLCVLCFFPGFFVP